MSDEPEALRQLELSRNEVVRLTGIVEAYRILAPRLIAQAQDARREQPARRMCIRMHPDEQAVCGLAEGHPGAHQHRYPNGGSRSWIP